MIQVGIYVLNPNRLKKLQRELGYLTSDEFFRTIPLANFESQVLEFLKTVSPEAKGNRYAEYLTSLGYRSSRAKDSLSHFKDGWRVSRETTGNKISFKVWNVLETVAGAKGLAKFKSVEYGSKTSVWIASRFFRFQSKQGWISIKAGQAVTHRGNKGVDAQSKTRTYIEAVLLPQIKANVEALVARRLA